MCSSEQKPTWIRILPGRNCQRKKHRPCQGITWPRTSFSASPAVEASRASLASPGSESAPHSNKRPWLASQGSGLNPQPYQTRILHVGATVAATFLWDKAVQETLERARERCRQRILSRGLPSLWNSPLENRHIQTSGKHCKPLLLMSFTLLVKGTSLLTPSSAVYVNFVEDPQLGPL